MVLCLLLVWLFLVFSYSYGRGQRMVGIELETNAVRKQGGQKPLSGFALMDM